MGKKSKDGRKKRRKEDKRVERKIERKRERGTVRHTDKLVIESNGVSSFVEFLDVLRCINM